MQDILLGEKRKGDRRQGEKCMDEYFQTTPTSVLNIIHAVKSNNPCVIHFKVLGKFILYNNPKFLGRGNGNLTGLLPLYSILNRIMLEMRHLLLNGYPLTFHSRVVSYSESNQTFL